MADVQEADAIVAEPEPSQADGEVREPISQPGTIEDLPDWAKQVVKDLRTENAKHRTANKATEKAAAKAEEDQLIAKGKIQEAYDKARGELDALQQSLIDSEKVNRKLVVGQRFKLPEALVDVLHGDSLEDMEAHAEILAALIPPAPISVSTDSTSGVNGSMPTPQMSDSEVNEMAVRLGVNPNHLKTSLGIEN